MRHPVTLPTKLIAKLGALKADNTMTVRDLIILLNTFHFSVEVLLPDGTLAPHDMLILEVQAAYNTKQ